MAPTVEHAVLDAETLSARDAYTVMTGLITPRPIAWVSTCDGQGRRNLAPFSYFQGVCSHPPTVILGIGWRPPGRAKDTLRNILEQREFTISHVSEPLAEAMNRTAADVGPDVDEWIDAGVEPTASTRVSPPWVAQARAAMECHLTHAIPLGEGSRGHPSSTLIIGRVLAFHAAAGLIRRDERGAILPLDPVQLAAVGRLGGMAYTKTTETFEMKRPDSSNPGAGRTAR